jgi:type IV secretory pathway VirB4 component
MHTQGIMSMFPFTSADLSHEEGVMVGLNQITGSPIILNRFMQPEIESPNTAIIGSTGSGKSFFAKLEMLRWAYLGKPVVVLDPSAEYKRVCQGVGGANIEINLDSQDIINPLDFSNAVRPGHNALNEKIGFLIELLKMMIQSEDGGVTIDAYSKSLFENALKIVYQGYGYFSEDSSTQQSANSEHMPVMSEVVFTLKEMARTIRDPEVQKRILPINASLTSYVEGHLAPLFNRRTTVDLRSHFINFDYSGLSSQYLSIGMYIGLEFLRTSYFTAQQQESGVNRIIYVDEAQVLLANVGTASFLDYTARTCRKYGIGLTVMTQNVGVFVQGEENNVKAGQGILSNCAIKVLLKQQPTEAEIIEKQFKLTKNEVSQLMGASAGEGLLFVGRDSVWFSAHNMASPEEYAMLTTTMSERAQLAQNQAEPSPELASAATRQIAAPVASQQPKESAPFASDPFANQPSEPPDYNNQPETEPPARAEDPFV